MDIAVLSFQAFSEVTCAGTWIVFDMVERWQSGIWVCYLKYEVLADLVDRAVVIVVVLYLCLSSVIVCCSCFLSYV